MPPTSPRTTQLFRLAAAGTALAGVAIIIVGIASIAQLHARFSLGVGLTLVLYGAAVLWAAWLGWRESVASTGLMSAFALLHVASLLSFASYSWWAVPVAAVPLATLVAAVMARVGQQKRASD